jgi:hypothetical protein
LPESILAALTASISPLVLAAALAIERARFWNSSFLATKSVSELSSITAAFLPLLTIAITPSEATRVAFLAALAIPFARSQSLAASKSPLVSSRAFFAI